MRPDVAAFRELDTLVRNLTEQLAGYRRRALAGEARARELEQRVLDLEAALTAVRAETAAAVRSPVIGTDTPDASGVSDASVLSEENARLRSRLADARERTTLLADRVRFLRQQLMQGTER